MVAGLGLAPSRQAILDHGGEIWAAGAGSRFVIRLPLNGSARRNVQCSYECGTMKSTNRYDLRLSSKLSNCVPQPFSECANAAASADGFQNVTSQLVAFFRAQGCALPVAEELAQKVTGELTVRVREVLWRPGLGAWWMSGVIQVGALTFDLERPLLCRNDEALPLSPKDFDLLAFILIP